jgi:hypothetical protein
MPPPVRQRGAGATARSPPRRSATALVIPSVMVLLRQRSSNRPTGGAAAPRPVHRPPLAPARWPRSPAPVVPPGRFRPTSVRLRASRAAFHESRVPLLCSNARTVRSERPAFLARSRCVKPTFLRCLLSSVPRSKPAESLPIPGAPGCGNRQEVYPTCRQMESRNGRKIARRWGPVRAYREAVTRGEARERIRRRSAVGARPSASRGGPVRQEAPPQPHPGAPTGGR